MQYFLRLVEIFSNFHHDPLNDKTLQGSIIINQSDGKSFAYLLK